MNDDDAEREFVRELFSQPVPRDVVPPTGLTREDVLRMNEATGTWTQIHNGTLFEAPDVDPYFYRERGSTDSERMLLYFLDRVEEATLKAGHPLNADERTTLVEKTLAHLTPHNKINVLLFDGEQLYVHTNYKGSLHVCEDGRSAWFSTLPLRHGNWEPLPMNRLLVYKNGQRIYEGASDVQKVVIARQVMGG